jgi:hypothetical protein
METLTQDWICCAVGTPFASTMTNFYSTSWNICPKQELGDTCLKCECHCASRKKLFEFNAPALFDEQTHTPQWHQLTNCFEHACHTNDTNLDIDMLVLIKLTTFIW